ncbi:hypothetical protein L4174_023795 (plasmid) [Photobacterium sp. CCB-ST2H9]|uniref:hypothetical protein n=1 Tax=Photobacterium sp. CCB-ST2H9 TaxID=2912855 RepID=UPI002003A3C5|nr:hypothetical protein [Photobacterium sp. CCB-ST2H9]UTM60492.1 hypothetical protein L4174_023795 [Photobacterium sp. CCB-ST2H9]
MQKMTVGEFIEHGDLEAIDRSIRECSDRELAAIANITAVLKEKQTRTNSEPIGEKYGTNGNKETQNNPQQSASDKSTTVNTSPNGDEPDPKGDENNPTGDKIGPNGDLIGELTHSGTSAEKISNSVNVGAESAPPGGLAGMTSILSEIRNLNKNATQGNISNQQSSQSSSEENQSNSYSESRHSTDTHTSYADASKLQVTNRPGDEIRNETKRIAENQSESNVETTELNSENLRQSARYENSAIRVEDNTKNSSTSISPGERVTDGPAASPTKIQNEIGKEEKFTHSSTSEISDLAKFWKDEKGRIRRPDGKYASKEQSEQYNKKAQFLEQHEQEKQTTLLGRLVEKMATASNASLELVKQSSDMGESNVVEGAGVGLGGSYYYAAKQVLDASLESVEKVTDLGKSATSKASKMKGWLAERFNKQSTEGANNYQTNTSAAGVQVPASMPGPTAAAASVSNSKTIQAKAESLRNQNIEVLRELSADDAKFHSQLLSKVDDLISAFQKSGNESGLLDGIGDLISFGGERAGKRGKKRGRKGAKGRPTSAKANGGKRISITGEESGHAKTTKPEKYRNRLKPGGNASASIADKLTSPKARVMPSVEGKALAGLKPGGAYTVAAGASKGATALKILGKGAAGVSGAITAYSKYNELKDRDDLNFSQKAVQTAAPAIGSMGGAMAGGMAGAAIGSVVPIVGTVIGGIIGSIAGSMGGEWLGNAAGEKLSQSIGNDDSLSVQASEVWEDAKEAAGEVAQSVKSMAPDWLVSGSETLTKMYSNAQDSIQSVFMQPQSIVDTVPAIKNMPEIQQHTSEKSNSDSERVVSLDSKSRALLENLAQSNGSISKTEKSATNLSNNSSAILREKAGSGIPSDFNDQYLRAISLDME